MKHLLLLVVTFLSALVSHGQTTIAHNGHTITIAKDSKANVTDPVTREHKEILVKGSPVSIDGRKLYSTQELSSPPKVKDSTAKDIKLSEYIFLALKSTMEGLADGRYVPNIERVVIDNTGKLIYWQFTGVKEMKITGGPSKYNYSDLPLDDASIPPKMQQQLKGEILQILQHFPKATPGTANNKAVNVTGYLFSKGNYIEVKNHKATLHQDYWSL